jgi:hypothetical protein
VAITDLITKVIAEDKFSQTFDNYNKKLETAEGRTDALGRGLGKLSAGAVAVGGLVAAAQVVEEYIDIAAEAGQASFNLADAINSANESFDVGSLQSWRDTIKEVGEATRIYSDKDLNNASAKIVDMTKRLGLSEDQMKSLLPAIANLSAGKFDLSNGSERVTAALRGEAESAEALGLTLSETQVREYAESHGLVFSALTENEKVQIRLALLMDQSNDKMNRAAGFAETQAGKQAALNAQLENQSAIIGQQLLPLWDGYAAVVGVAASQTGEGVGFITQTLATLLATLLTVATGFTTWKNQTLAAVGNVKAGLDALLAGENPLTAFAEAEEASRESMAGFGEFLADIPGVFNRTKEQIVSGWQEQADAAESASARTQAASQKNAEALDTEAIAARIAAETMAAEYEKAQEQRTKAAQQAAQRIGDLEFDHAQKMRRLQAEVAQAIAEAATEASKGREEAAQELAQGLADIEQDLAGDIADISRDLAQTLSDLEQQRSDARRDRNREIQDIERGLAQDLADLEFESQQERNAIATSLAEDRAKALTDLEEKRLDITTGLEEDRLRTQQEFANRRVQSEQDYQNALKRLNDDFEGEFAEADPFRRQILEFNRAEQLKALEQQRNDEQSALKTQEDAALAALQTKADNEIAILEARTQAELTAEQARAGQRLALLDEESARDRQRLLDDANFAREKANERLNDETEQINRRRAQAEQEAAENRARREREAAEARNALQARNAEELAQINEQEQKRVQAANEQITREQQNYADRLAALQRDNAQTLGEITTHLSEIERSEGDSWNRRVSTAQQASEEIRRANELAMQSGFGSGGGSSAGGGGGTTGGFGGHGTTPVLVPSITIVNQGGSNGFATGNQNANQVAQALRDTLNGGA